MNLYQSRIMASTLGILLLWDQILLREHSQITYVLHSQIVYIQRLILESVTMSGNKKPFQNLEK